MKRRLPTLLLAALLLLGALAAHLWRRQRPTPPPPPPPPYLREFTVFGTFGRLQFHAPAAQAAPVADQILEQLQALHNRLNKFDPASELARLNRTAATAPFACSPELWAVLQAAREAHRETNGAFDVSVGPLMQLWGLHRQRRTLPTDAEIAEAQALVGLDKLQFDDAARTVRFPRPGMELDFGGLAKGYALDLARATALAGGLRQGLIDLGGNIACLPDAPAGRNAYRIGIRHPLRPSEVLAQVELRDACIATSGDYERRIILEGKSIGHIMDPRTGRPAADRLAVTVITRRGLDSDVYSTAIFVAGPAVAARLRARDPECRLLLCRPDASPAGFRADWLPEPPPLEFTLQCGTCRPGDPSQGGKWAVQRKRRLPPKQPTLKRELQPEPNSPR